MAGDMAERQYIQQLINRFCVLGCKYKHMSGCRVEHGMESGRQLA